MPSSKNTHWISAWITWSWRGCKQCRVWRKRLIVFIVNASLAACWDVKCNQRFSTTETMSLFAENTSVCPDTKPWSLRLWTLSSSPAHKLKALNSWWLLVVCIFSSKMIYFIATKNTCSIIPCMFIAIHCSHFSMHVCLFVKNQQSIVFLLGVYSVQKDTAVFKWFSSN